MALTKTHNRMIQGAPKSVKDFNAVGDGVTDDTTAFTNAGLGAYVPSGTYLVDTSTVNPWDYYGAGTIKAKTGQLISLESALSQNIIVQKKMMEPFFGFDNGTTSTEIFDGAEQVSQGLAYVNDKVYISQTVTPYSFMNGTKITAGSFVVGVLYEITSAGTTDFTLIGSANNSVGTRFTATGVGSGSGKAVIVEQQRIVEFTLNDDGSVVANNVFTNPLSLGHQGLSAVVEGSSVYLYSQNTTQPTYGGTDGGKGFSKILWNGASTSSIQNYQLFGYQGSGHKYENYHNATPCVSTDGRYIIMVAASQTNGSLDDSEATMFVYDRAYVEALGDPLDAIPLYVCSVPFPEAAQRTDYTQGVASDGKYVYILRGFSMPRYKHIVQKFDFYGTLISEIEIDDARAQYGVDGLLNNSTLGFPYSFEPEGISLVGDQLLVCVMDWWVTGSDIVTYNGKNYAARQDHTSKAPDATLGESFWVETTKTATAGSWTTGVSYTTGNFTRRSKLIYSIKPETGSANEEPVNAGLTSRVSAASTVSRENGVNVSVKNGEEYNIARYSELTGSYVPLVTFGLNGYVSEFYDARVGSTQDRNSTINSVQEETPSVRSVMEIRSDRTISNGASINLYGGSDSTNPDRARIYAGGSFSSQEVFVDLVNSGGPALRPNAGLSGSIDLGGASHLWDTVFASTGTINTSDERAKQDIRDLSAAEAAVAVRLKGLVKAYRFKSAYEAKGDDARIHIGVIAQDVVAAFQAEGLDPMRYGVVCYDKWDADEEKEAGDAYGVRYDELWAFIISAL